jgi:hypothetical protein
MRISACDLAAQRYRFTYGGGNSHHTGQAVSEGVRQYFSRPARNSFGGLVIDLLHDFQVTAEVP